MLDRHRTKAVLTVLCIVVGVLLYWGYQGPSSDHQILGYCLIGFAVIVFPFLWLVPIARCPRCGNDLGYFHGIGKFRNLNRSPPRYIHCRRCGCRIDRWNDSIESPSDRD